jgi:hypothetical protein
MVLMYGQSRHLSSVGIYIVTMTVLIKGFGMSGGGGRSPVGISPEGPSRRRTEGTLSFTTAPQIFHTCFLIIGVGRFSCVF